MWPIDRQFWCNIRKLGGKKKKKLGTIGPNFFLKTRKTQKRGKTKRKQKKEKKERDVTEGWGGGRTEVKFRIHSLFLRSRSRSVSEHCRCVPRLLPALSQNRLHRLLSSFAIAGTHTDQSDLFIFPLFLFLFPPPPSLSARYWFCSRSVLWTILQRCALDSRKSL